MINLSKPQKSIYNMEKFAGGSIAVICSSMLRVGTIDVNLLKETVNTLYRINDALRIHITETSNGTKQTVYMCRLTKVFGGELKKRIQKNMI